MSTVSSGRGFRGSVARAATLATLAVAGLLALAPRAGAEELLYWENWNGPSDSISYANLDGSGGGPLNLTGITLNDPEGIAYDTVSNALYVANSNAGSEETGEIDYVDLGGGGAAAFNAAGAPIAEPAGVAVWPEAGTVYWVNSKPGSWSIAWGRKDGVQGGTLNTTGATLEAPYKVALDTSAERIYWANSISGADSISYANLDGSGGGDLDLSGATPANAISGLSVDSAGGRIYWVDAESGRVSYASLAGGSGGDLPTTGASSLEPYGLALDPSLGRVYWANYGVLEAPTNAFGFAATSGAGGGNISIQAAPVNGPQDPLIIKSPTATASPQLARSASSRQWLSCSQGEWGEDYLGSFVYQAPRSYAYAWVRNGKAVEGAASPKLKATAQGKYRCKVTATNQAGLTTVQTSQLKVNGAKLKTLVKTKVKKVRAGKQATFRVQYYNQGDLKSAKPRVCVIVPKAARKHLKAQKCRKLGKIKGKGRRGTKLKVSVKPGAAGSYKLKFVVKGVPSKPGYGRVKIVG